MFRLEMQASHATKFSAGKTRRSIHIEPRHNKRFINQRIVFVLSASCRFREFVDVRQQLLAHFSGYPLPLPELPPKTLLATTDSELLKQRRVV